MHCNVWRDKTLSSMNLCDWGLTRIISTNKSHTKVCRFTVYKEKRYSVLFFPPREARGDKRSWTERSSNLTKLGQKLSLH